MKDSDTSAKAGRLSVRVFGVVLAYAFFAGLWILLSDRAMGLLFSDPDTLVRISMGKGWLFVAVTSALLFFLVRRLVGQIDAAHKRELVHLREQQKPPPMLTAIAESSSDAIYAKDEAGRYLLINTAAARSMGKRPEEILGRDDFVAYGAEVAAQFTAADRRVLESGQTQTSEEVLQTAEGARVLLATKGPLRDAQGRVFGLFGISRDITERTKVEAALRESQQRLELFVEHAPVALAMFDHSMRYLVASRRWIEDLHLDGSNLLGRSHYEVLPEIGADLKAIHQRGLAGECMAMDAMPFVRADGRVQWLRWAMRPWLQDDAGAVGGIVIFAEDITERRKADDELRARNEDLERFNRAAIDRELRMIELKREVNALAGELGREPRYTLSALDFPPSDASR